MSSFFAQGLDGVSSLTSCPGDIMLTTTARSNDSNLPGLLYNCARFSINDRVRTNRVRPFRLNNALSMSNLFRRAVGQQDKPT